MPRDGARRASKIWSGFRARSSRRARPVRIAAIAGLFLVGGGLIYFAAEPFLGSLLAVSTALGHSRVRVRAVGRAVRLGVPGKGLGVLLGAHGGGRFDRADEHDLEQHQPVDAARRRCCRSSIRSAAARVSAIPLDGEQEVELLLTLAQALLGALFLLEMQLQWWEAAGLFVLWFVAVRALAGGAGPCSTSRSRTSRGRRWMSS